ncbi:14788_t:CDS:2 [Gigaspora margarita]|uniref:14788_t:CDS:1 n=1 Tax=Gigaspora margarita TaxID=4874 RepID=A0ABN7VBZ7_GIGMA|nr:14788_t:CDS:2 [Gigaspora margarita]
MSYKEPKKTKTALTNKQRKAIINYKEKHPQISQTDLVDWIKQTMDLKVHQSTISHLIKNKDEIREIPLTKRQKTVRYPVLENILFDWLQKFKQRHGLKKITKHEEDAPVDEKAIEIALPQLRAL